MNHYFSLHPFLFRTTEIITNAPYNLFKSDNCVQYLALSTTRGISLKERENLSTIYEQNRSIYGRDCMPKWCIADHYISQISQLGCSSNPIIFQELYKDFIPSNSGSSGFRVYNI